jgi:vacuolar-type H+-ATPase catalytic subunit A/Vma1
MTEVEFSRKMGVLVAYLNQAAVKRLFDAIKESNSYETLQEPYKTWLTNKSAIPTKDLRENAKEARKAKV